MICPDCVKGMVVELRTKGQVHPYRETSILTYPKKYIKKVPCQSCDGSGVVYNRGESTFKADEQYRDLHGIDEKNSLHP